MRTVAIAVGAVVTLAGGLARADLADWEVNEVVGSVDGNPAIRFVELTNGAGGCLFPTSRVDVRDAAGALIAAAPLVTSTTCFEAGWYLLLATPQAVAYFGIPSDAGLVAPLDPGAGQVCFASSGTHYDCVRWGDISDPVTDFFGADDVTVAPVLSDGVALARTQTTHVIAEDWARQSPTPRAPNDGTPWTPPDAGPLPDAAATPDAGPLPDAGPPPDAAPPADASVVPDARNDTYLDIEPRGGAACDCRLGGRARPGAGAAFLALPMLWLLRRRATGCARRRPSQ